MQLGALACDEGWAGGDGDSNRVSLETLSSFLSADQLRKAREEMLAHALQEDNAVKLLEAASRGSDAALEGQCLEFIARQAGGVLRCGGVDQLETIGAAKSLLAEVLRRVVVLEGEAAALQADKATRRRRLEGKVAGLRAENEELRRELASLPT